MNTISSYSGNTTRPSYEIKKSKPSSKLTCKCAIISPRNAPGIGENSSFPCSKPADFSDSCYKQHKLVSIVPVMAARFDRLGVTVQVTFDYYHFRYSMLNSPSTCANGEVKGGVGRKGVYVNMITTIFHFMCVY